MPGARDPNKALASFWMHKDIYHALGVVAKLSDKSMTRLILEALSVKLGFSLDEVGNPLGLDLDALTRDAFVKAKRPSARKKAAGEGG